MLFQSVAGLQFWWTASRIWMWLFETRSTKESLFVIGFAWHTSWVLDSHPPAPGLILSIPRVWSQYTVKKKIYAEPGIKPGAAWWKKERFLCYPACRYSVLNIAMGGNGGWRWLNKCLTRQGGMFLQATWQSSGDLTATGLGMKPVEVIVVSSKKQHAKNTNKSNYFSNFFTLNNLLMYSTITSSKKLKFQLKWLPPFSVISLFGWLWLHLYRTPKSQYDHSFTLICKWITSLKAISRYLGLNLNHVQRIPL